MFGGLEGGFGSLTIGRQYTASYVAAASIGAAKGDGLLGNSATLVPLVGGMPTRVNNSITYKSPKLQGASGWLTYFGGVQNNLAGDAASSPATTPATMTNSGAGRGIDLAVAYAAGPLSAMVTAWSLNNNSWLAAGETGLAKKKGVQLAGNYDFGAVRVFANFAHGTIDGGNYENVTQTLSDADAYSLSALVPLGKHTLSATYGTLNDKSNLNKDGKLYGLSYWYSVNPSLRLYAGAGKMANSARSSYGLADAANLVGNVAGPGTSPKGVQAGLNFNF